MTETKFTHTAPVIKVLKEKVETSDTLSVVRLFDNSAQVVVKTVEWEDGELAVWVQPQSIVDTNMECFSWLKKDTDQFVRVKPVKLRGVLSQGCFAKIPSDLIGKVNEGDDLAEVLNVKHWEPEEQYDHLSTGGEWDNGGYFQNISKYDVDSGLKLHKYFQDDWEVSVTSKIHGANCRVFFDKDSQTFKVGTRNHWVKEPLPGNKGSVHWNAFYSLSDEAKQFLKDNENHILYGEAYGDVKGFWYGAKTKTIRFAAFDIMMPNRRFLCYNKFSELCNTHNISRVPELYRGPHNYELFLTMKDRMAYWDNTQVEEGVVIKTTIERQIGKNYDRAIYKLINKDYKG